MDLPTLERPIFSVGDGQEASTSDADAELEEGDTAVEDVEETDGTGEIECTNDAEEIGELPSTEQAEFVVPDSEFSNNKEESPNSPLSQSDSAGDLLKVKGKNRTATSYTQHIPTEPENIIEYEWPEKAGVFYFIQEQISQLLDVKSFKRKYPDLTRRTVEPEERDFLMQQKNLAKTMPIQMLNHLTAVRSVEVLDMMSSEYPAIHAGYQKVIADRRKQALIEKQKELDLIKSDTKKLEELRKKAIKSATKFNGDLQTVKRSERKFFLDTQTSIVQSARNRWRRLPPAATRPSPYPVALIPGQFTSHFKRFNADELYGMPLSTVVKNKSLFVPRCNRSPSPIRVTDGEVTRPQHKTENDALTEMDVDQSSLSRTIKEENDTATVDNKEKSSVGPLKPGRRSSTASNGQRKPRKSSSTTNRVLFSEAVKTELLSAMSPSAAAAAVNAMSSGTLGSAAFVGSPIPEEDHRCIICNMREAEIPQQGLSVDLSKARQTPFVRCADCFHEMHAGCIDMSAAMVDEVRKYNWRCAECKECTVCGKPDQEDAMMCCDLCDRGYHTFCIGITAPPTGPFICLKCGK